jgi:competence ComEA-like helix-hairpin-helix protein
MRTCWSVGRSQLRNKGWVLWGLLLFGLILLKRARESQMNVGILVHQKGYGVVRLRPGATIAPSEREWFSPYRLAMGRPVSINNGTEEQLRTVPNIGPRRAASIVEYRTYNGYFNDISALQRVHGVGPKTVELVAPFVVY